MHEDYLLQSATSQTLYHDFAEDLPILDYHCHLSPEDVAVDRRFANLSEIWLAGDHYKWRAMRANGVGEEFCTGDASDWEKFEKWAETVPYLLGNQLYPWTHLELSRYFGNSDTLLSPDTAAEVWERANAILAEPGFSARGIRRRMNVKLLCTTDDPVDSLEHHRVAAEAKDFSVRMLPTWRPDKAMAVDRSPAFNVWVGNLEAAADVSISNYDDFLEALRHRHDYFHECGCRLSDHGIETFYTAGYAERDLKAVFESLRMGLELSEDETLKFKSALLHEFGLMDHEKGWVQQFHVGAMRNVRTRLFDRLGADAGGDCMGDAPIARPLARFLDRLDKSGQLAKTIVYNINPRDNDSLVSVLASFQDASVAGKMQLGSAWWFMDQKDGIERQLEALSQNGLLRNFAGMVTDSRSFLSYPRHEYFRRILCNKLGREVEAGLLPNDLELIGALVKDVSYNNAATYFGFDIETP